MRQLAWSVAAFLLVTTGFFAANLLGGVPAVPGIYHYSLSPAGNGALADAASAVNALVFVFVSSLLFFGYAAPFAMAYEAAKYASLFLSGQASPLDFLLVLPQLIAIAAGLRIVEGVEDDFSHRGILYARLWEGAKLLALAFLVLAALIFIRPLLA